MYHARYARYKNVLWLKIFLGYMSTLCLSWKEKSRKIVLEKSCESTTLFLWGINTINQVNDQRFNL